MSKKSSTITVHPLTRVEGHGEICIKIKDGKVQHAHWAVIETPRFFEAILKGMSIEMAHFLTARICGICSIGHALACLRATERAMGVQVPKAAETVRLLSKHGETLQSHALHLFFLAAPDFFKVHSVIPLIQSHPEVVGIAARLKKLANTMCDWTAGRTTHPVSFCVGGLRKAPSKRKLEEMRKMIEDRMPDMRASIDLFKTFQMPDFERETEFVSLEGKGGYPWIGGNLLSTDGVLKDESEYLAMTNEYKEDFTTTKHTKLSRESFAVGALARFNNNFRFLKKKAKEAAKEFGLFPVNHNPFMNNAAQLIECCHVMLESIELIDELLDDPLKDLKTRYKVRAGQGSSAVEVPRGILYHDYTIDKSGKIVKANCVIPTTQNHANIHYDIKALAAKLAKRKKKDSEIKLLSEMLVRAYDPCISCSVH